MANIRTYINKLKKRCAVKFGEDYCIENEELIECAARNKKLLDRFDDEIDEQSLTVVSIGSQGQQKEDINPIIKHRNDVAKLYADNLDALQLTPRSKFKKQEGKVMNENDAMQEYLAAIQN